MRSITPEEVPVFKNLVHFTEWYLNSGMPTLIPYNAEVFLTDDATATCLFRHGRYQFEMYFIHPNPTIPQHSHPGVENIEIPSSSWARLTPEILQRRIQKENQTHGRDIRERAACAGFALFSAQRWDDGLEISTIGARWKGFTAGPKHDALIRRFNPDCYSSIGYADVTRKREIVATIL